MVVLCQISYREIAFLLNHNRASLSERLMCLGTIELRSLIIVMVQRDRVPPSEQFFIEQTTSVSPCARQEHWVVRPRLGAVLKRSSQVAFRLSDLLFREEHCKTEQGIGLLTISVRQLRPIWTSQICAVKGQHLYRTSRL